MNACRYIIVVLFYCVGSVFGQLTHEQSVIAQTLLGEARGEGKAGMYAVACVIKQRMKLKSYPNTATGVCLEPKQYYIVWK